MKKIIFLILAGICMGYIGFRKKRGGSRICTKDGRENVSHPPQGEAYSSGTQEVSGRNENVRKGQSAFSLRRLDALFREYGIPLRSDYSFTRLLNAIEREAYNKMVKYIFQEVHNSEDLSTFLAGKRPKFSEIHFSDGADEPFLTQAAVDALLQNENVSEVSISTMEEKIMYLMKLAHRKGVERFDDAFENEFSLFRSLYAEGEDTSVVYGSIKTEMENQIKLFM